MQSSSNSTANEPTGPRAELPNSTRNLPRETAVEGAHSFIVKVWVEETRPNIDRATWRGHITHVLSGQRQYLQKLDDIISFMVPFLAQMGVDVDSDPVVDSTGINSPVDLRTPLRRLRRRLLRSSDSGQTEHE